MSTLLDLVSQLVDIPNGTPKKLTNLFNSHCNDNPLRKHKVSGSAPVVDILETPEGYVFYMDVPGLSKSDIQVTVEDENTLVIKSNGKRKREDVEEEDCKYMVLERKLPQNLMRKFRLPENCDSSAITAKCENGVLTVIVEKLPPQKPKTVEISIS